MREDRGIGKYVGRYRVADPLGMGPLKFVLAILPFSLFLVLWPKHQRLAMSLGMALGVVCAQLVPPRDSIRWMILKAALFAVIGAALAQNW